MAIKLEWKSIKYGPHTVWESRWFVFKFSVYKEDDAWTLDIGTDGVAIVLSKGFKSARMAKTHAIPGLTDIIRGWLRELEAKGDG